MKIWKYYLIAVLVILIDQGVKLFTHFNMELGPVGEIQLLGDIFKLHYTLNPGMAFGIILDFEYGKLALSLFRIVAVIGIGFYIKYLYDSKAPQGLLICIGMILGGAIGNVLDSIFYGVAFNNAPYNAPTPWFHGQVIDMFYLDLYEGFLPEWLGGGWISLWPIFNVADAAIFTAVAILLIWQRKFFDNESNTTNTQETIS